MRTTVALLTFAVLLSACSPSVRQLHSEINLPEELKDCKFFRVKLTSDSTPMTVVRCPLSSTAVTQTEGKTTNYTMTTEGVTSAEKSGRLIERIEADLAELKALKEKK